MSALTILQSSLDSKKALLREFQKSYDETADHRSRLIETLERVKSEISELELSIKTLSETKKDSE
jgi:septal ring factor EnvC (AmiA/AmiB activator)